jgi:hypothetical protein
MQLLELAEFHTAKSTEIRPGESWDDHCNRTYRPSFPGVHVCGGDHDANRVFTVLNIPARSDAEARVMWEAARAECEVPKDEHDVVVDLNTQEGCCEDFYSNRQMLVRLQDIALRARDSGAGVAAPSTRQ